MLEVRFEIQEADADRWSRVFQLLEAGDCGINFQEEMEVFGDRVSAVLEEVLDVRGAEGSFYAESWSQNGNEFCALFHLEDLSHAQDILKVFKLCPVKILRASIEDS